MTTWIATLVCETSSQSWCRELALQPCSSAGTGRTTNVLVTIYHTSYIIYESHTGIVNCFSTRGGRSQVAAYKNLLEYRLVPIWSPLLPTCSPRNHHIPIPTLEIWKYTIRYLGHLKQPTPYSTSSDSSAPTLRASVLLDSIETSMHCVVGNSTMPAFQ